MPSCQLHTRHDHSKPLIELPDSFEEEVSLETPPDRWWESYGDVQLNFLVMKSLLESHQLKSAWFRLQQAQAIARQGRAARFPEVGLGASATWNRTKRHEGPITGVTTKSDNTVDSYGVGPSLSYQVDLWGQIESRIKASALRAQASAQDAHSTALVLSGSVASQWFIALEQIELINTIEKQIEINKQFLELTELRFGLGEGSSLDVIQQREQLAATRSQLPPVSSNLQNAKYQLAVLCGKLPKADLNLKWNQALPSLPKFPTLPSPTELLNFRPDLRAAWLRLQAADEDIAVAIADRLPKLDISLSYSLAAGDLARFVQQELTTLLGSLNLPLIDGGRRKAEVDRAKASLHELAHSFTQNYLTALLEIESARNQEKYQLALLERLEQQLELAKASVEESRSRYSNGLGTYLNVLTALQSLQSQERRIISEKRVLLNFRNQLYLALGTGNWIQELPTPADPSLKEISAVKAAGDTP